jgi:hypothetical protein
VVEVDADDLRECSRSAKCTPEAFIGHAIAAAMLADCDDDLPVAVQVVVDGRSLLLTNAPRRASH